MNLLSKLSNFESTNIVSLSVCKTFIFFSIKLAKNFSNNIESLTIIIPEDKIKMKVKGLDFTKSQSNIKELKDESYVTYSFDNILVNDNLELIFSKPLENYISTVSEPLLVIDYTSSGFSLDNVVKLKNENVNLKILAITPYTNANTIVQAVQAGVESHLKKECSVDEIKEAFVATLKGEKFFCDDIVKQMRNEQIDIEKIQFKSLDPSTVQLSERELQIIQFIAEGSVSYTHLTLPTSTHV